MALKKIDQDLPSLAKAVNEESWKWLQDNLPELATALKDEVIKGATPEDIRFFIMAETQREALALRCRQAAGFLEMEK